LTQPLIESPRSCSLFPCWLASPVAATNNEQMNRFAVETLDVQPKDQVLEIGFGHGHAIRLIAERANQGLVAGVDPSNAMVRHAAKRNRELIKAGSVELWQGSVSNIPYEYARFDRVLAVDNYQHWPHAEFNLVEVQRVLKPGGPLALCVRMQRPLMQASGFTREDVEEAAGLVRWVGFHDVRIIYSNEHGYRRRDGAACIIARR
ncbi:MAG: class I SAM-dependent methyltransferase, partial [Acidobacteriota bacterium]